MRRRRGESIWVVVGSALLCFVGMSRPAWAGAWTLPRNRWYTEEFFRYLGSKKEFNSQRHSSRRAKTAISTDIRNELKLEYGLLKGVTLLGSVPYSSSHYRDDNVDLLTTGAGDIHLRTKLRALVEPVVASAQFSWKIPGGYDVRESPSLGDGQFDFESRLLASKSFPYAPYKVPIRREPNPDTDPSSKPQATPAAPKTREDAIREALDRLLVKDAEASSHPASDAPAPVEVVRPRPTEFEEGELGAETLYSKVAFVNLEGAFTARHGAPANEFPMAAELGFTPFKRLMLISSLESVVSVKSTHEDLEDYSKWGLRAIINLTGAGFASVFREGVGTTVNFEVGYNDIFAGKNTTDGFEVFSKIGVVF